MLYFTMLPIVMRVHLELHNSAIFSTLYEKYVVPRFLFNSNTRIKATILSAAFFCSDVLATKLFQDYCFVIKSEAYWILRSPYIIFYFQSFTINLVNFFTNIFDLQLYNIYNFELHCVFGFLCYGLQLCFGIKVIKVSHFENKTDESEEEQPQSLPPTKKLSLLMTVLSSSSRISISQPDNANTETEILNTEPENPDHEQEVQED